MRHIDSGSVILAVDDGFDSISVKCKAASIPFVLDFGEYVKITGRCEVFRKDLQVRAFYVNILNDIEELAWALELEDFWRAVSIQHRGKFNYFHYYHFSRDNHS